MNKKNGKVISIYTPAVPLKTLQEYANRISFLGYVLASKNCSISEAEEIHKEMINLIEYLHLIQQRKLLKKEQKSNPKTHQNINVNIKNNKKNE